MSELSQAQNLITPKNQIGLIGILLCAFSAPLIMPLNIIAISQRFIDATNGQIGTIATFETLSISIASIILSRIINRLDRRKIFITSAILVILGNILTILSPTLNYVILARVISGLGSGAIVATVVATIARGSNAQMTFALLNSGVGVMGVLLPFCLPIIIASNGMNGAYSFHLFISLFTFLFISFLTLSSDADDNQNTVSSYKGYAGWASMIGTSLIFLGHAGIFAFSAKIGATLGISVIQVGYVFMAGGLLTIFGPLLAGFIGQRFGSLFPCLILITILLVTGIILANVTSALIFFIVVPLCGMIPMILTPFFLGGMAKLDPSGSLAAAHPAFSTMGGAAGPVVMGYTIDMAGFTSIGWVLIVMVIVGTPLISLGLIEADKIKA
tara:strand:+ start:1430 stop:2587 length:1158 start_codon:yes stop_codon:yes gene_type:complete